MVFKATEDTHMWSMVVEENGVPVTVWEHGSSDGPMAEEMINRIDIASQKGDLEIVEGSEGRFVPVFVDLMFQTETF